MHRLACTLAARFHSSSKPHRRASCKRAAVLYLVPGHNAAYCLRRLSRNGWCRVGETMNGRQQAAGRGEAAALVAAAEGLLKCGEVRALSRATCPTIVC